MKKLGLALHGRVGANGKNVLAGLRHVVSNRRGLETCWGLQLKQDQPCVWVGHTIPRHRHASSIRKLGLGQACSRNTVVQGDNQASRVDQQPVYRLPGPMCRYDPHDSPAHSFDGQ